MSQAEQVQALALIRDLIRRVTKLEQVLANVPLRLK